MKLYTPCLEGVCWVWMEGDRDRVVTEGLLVVV